MEQCNIKLYHGTGTKSAISNYIMALEQRVQYQIRKLFYHGVHQGQRVQYQIISWQLEQ